MNLNSWFCNRKVYDLIILCKLKRSKDRKKIPKTTNEFHNSSVNNQTFCLHTTFTQSKMIPLAIVVIKQIWFLDAIQKSQLNFQKFITNSMYTKKRKALRYRFRCKMLFNNFLCVYFYSIFHSFYAISFCGISEQKKSYVWNRPLSKIPPRMTTFMWTNKKI